MNYYYIKRFFDQERFFINMDVYESVFRAIDIWLKDITIRENQIKIIKRKLRRNILQIKYEGLLSIIEISELDTLIPQEMIDLVCNDMDDRRLD